MIKYVEESLLTLFSNVGGLAIALLGIFNILISKYQGFAYDYSNIKEFYWVEAKAENDDGD